MEVPFNIYIDHAPDRDAIRITFSIYVKFPHTSWEEGQYIYAVYYEYPTTTKQERKEERRKTIDNLLELFIIYYDEGYTEIVEIGKALGKI